MNSWRSSVDEINNSGTQVLMINSDVQVLMSRKKLYIAEMNNFEEQVLMS
jgi:hypothetical protein